MAAFERVRAGGRLLAELTLSLIGLGCGVGFIALSAYLGIHATHAHRMLTIVVAIVLLGPLALAGVANCVQAARGVMLRYGEFTGLPDVSAPRLVIPRKPGNRLVPTIMLSYLALFIAASLALGLSEPVLNVTALIIGAGFLVHIAWTLWTTWHPDKNLLQPIVLDEEGLEDRGAHRPKIPWRDVRKIHVATSTIVLAKGSIAADRSRRGRFSAWLHGVARVSISTNGAQPDGIRAMKLIKAYWQRRVAMAHRGTMRDALGG